MTDLPFEFENAQDSPGLLLWQVSILWQRLIKKALEPYDVSHAQFVIMAVLLWLEKHQECVTQSIIIDWTKLDKMTVSKSMKKLVGQGLINRVEHAVDTRAKSVNLTDRGKSIVHQLVPAIEKIDAVFFNRVSQSDQHVLSRILNEIVGVSHEQ